MLFKITQRRDRQIVSDFEAVDKAAADAIENWQSRFTDKPRTRYGRKLTLEYVRDLTVGERGVFDQPNERFTIQRVA